MSERERPKSDPPRRRRRRGLVVLLSVIVVVLLAEAGLVVAVFVPPSAGERLESAATSARRAWGGTEGEPGVRTRSAQAAERWFDAHRSAWRGPEEPQAEPGVHRVRRLPRGLRHHPAIRRVHEPSAARGDRRSVRDPPPHEPAPKPAASARGGVRGGHAEVRQEDQCS